MTTQEFDIAVTAFVMAYRMGETAEKRMDNAYDEWLEENLDKFPDDDAERDFAQWKGGGERPRNCSDVAEVERLWQDYQSELTDRADDWTTINGTHVLLNEEGIAQGGGGLKGMSFSNAKSQTAESKHESAFKARGEYKPGATFQEWQRANMVGRDNPTRIALSKIFKEEGIEGVQKEYYSSRTLSATKDLHHISDREADEVLSEHMSQNVFHGWFRDANSEYKPRVISAVTATPEARNAALSIMYDNYRELTGGKMGYDEFLKTPIPMFRGGHGQGHTKDDIFSSFSFDRGVAEKFAGANGTVYEAKIRPIDTWGSITTNKESEIMVPSWITPNKHKDSRADGGVVPPKVRTGKSLLSQFWITGNKYISEKLLDFITRSAIIKLCDESARADDGPDAWVTLENGAHIPLNESGKAMGGAGGWAKGKDFSKTKGEYKKGTVDKPSAKGENVPCTGFRNYYAAQRHEKHWAEFGFSSRREYEKAAIDFIKQPVGGHIGQTGILTG